MPPDLPWLHKPNMALQSRRCPIYDIFEGTAEIQQLVISRAISGMHIK
jgi:alkylation response protein AidB-like acyl-CoA dehydrogenase